MLSLIVCCLEVLPLRPFTFFVLSNVFPDFGSVGRSVGKEKTPKKMEKKSRTRRPGTSAHAEPRNDKTRLNSNVKSEKRRQNIDCIAE